MKLPEVIVFDVGGTLIKNVNFNYDKAFEYLKLVFKADDSFISKCNLFKEEYIDKRDKDEKEIPFKFLLKYLSNYFDLKCDCDLLFLEENFRKSLYSIVMVPDADKCLKFLKDKGVKLHCFSNSIFSSEEIKLELDQFNLSQYFDTIESSADYGLRKPSKEVFEQYIKLANGNGIWFIGNEIKYDIMPVLDLGGRPILYSNKTWRHPEFTEIKSYADFIKLIEEN